MGLGMNCRGHNTNLSGKMSPRSSSSMFVILRQILLFGWICRCPIGRNSCLLRRHDPKPVSGEVIGLQGREYRTVFY